MRIGIESSERNSGARGVDVQQTGTRGIETKNAIADSYAGKMNSTTTRKHLLGCYCVHTVSPSK